MANTEDILAELDGFIGGASEPTAPIAGVNTAAASPRLGADLLGNLGKYYTPSGPSASDIAYEALVPSTKAAVENVVGLGNVLGAGADYAKYGLSYLSPFEALGSRYRASVDKEVELAKQKAAQKNEETRISLGLTPDQYAEFKKQEANKTYRHVGGQLVGGLAGAYGGAATGAGIGTALFPGPGTAIGAGLGTVGGLIGAYLGSGGGELGVQAAEEAAGLSKPTTALEKARMFSEAGTGGLVGEALPGVAKLGYKGTVKAGQAGRAFLGPRTIEEALGTIQPAMEKAMPAAKVRSAIARGAAREQTSGMRTTGELLGTPEALGVEQSIGLHPTQQAKYNARLIDNEKESQSFLLDDLSKNLTKQTKTAKTTPRLDVKGDPIPETATSHLKTGEVSTGTIGEEMNAAFDDVVKQSDKAVSELYGGITHTKTAGKSMRYAMHDALKSKFPMVEGKTNKAGISTMEYSGAPTELTNLVKDIGSKTAYSTKELQMWQSQLRSMGKRFARNGNDTAAAAAGDVRTALTNEIKATSAGEKWTGAKAAAKEQADLIENHELGKVLKKEDLNGETIFNKVTANESNAKNFISIVGEDHPVVRSAKAYAIKTVEGIESAAKRATWIENNQKWLKHFMSKSELESLNEVAKVGRIAESKGAKLNPQRGSPTATRLGAAREGLARILGRGTDTVSEVGKAAAKERRDIAAVLGIGGSALGGALAYSLGGGSIGAGVGSLLGGYALAKGKGSVAKRVAAGTDLLREAAYDIAMNPKVAGYTAPKLAKALAAEKAAAVATAGKAGAITGRAAQAATYAGKLFPSEQQQQARPGITRRPSVHDSAANALKEIETMLGAEPSAAKTVSVPKVVRAKRVNVSKAEGDAHIATKPPIIQAMAMAESAGNDKAVSPRGARGRMQLMPATAKELGVKNIHDPIENIDAGERYFNKYADKYGDERIGLIAYNWGPGRVDRIANRFAKRGIPLTWSNIEKYATLPSETEQYITRVMKNKQKLMRA